MIEAAGDPGRLGRLAGRALVGGLCVAASVAILAVLTGSFDDTDWRVVGASLGFSVLTSTAAAGAALRLREHEWARAVGTLTVAASVAALGLLFVALWFDDSESEGLWRAFGVAGLLALWTSHASLVLRALRPTDPPAVRRLTGVSIVTLGIDTWAGELALLGVLDDYDEGLARLLAALLVISLLSSALPPIVRRVRRSSPAVAAPSPSRGLAEELAEAVERLQAMDLPPQARVEIDRLRRLARESATRALRSGP